MATPLSHAYPGAATHPEDPIANAQRFVEVPPPISHQPGRTVVPQPAPPATPRQRTDLNQIPGYDRPAPTATGGRNGQVRRPDGGTPLLPEKAMAWMDGDTTGAVGPQGNLTRASLKQVFPGTAATLAESGEDFSGALRDGRYADAVGHGIRQVVTTPLALADDATRNIRETIGGFVHGTDKIMTGPVEGAGRTALGLPPRPVASPAPSAPSLAYQPNPTDQRLAAGTQRSPLNGPASPPSSTNQPAVASGREVVPGVYNHGRGQYSDNPNGMGMPEGFTGRPSAQNDAILQRMSDQSQAESMARVSADSAAKQYNAEVQRAQAINADERARHNSPAARMQRLADPFTAEGRALRNLRMDIDSSLDRKGRPTGETQALVDQYKAATGAYLEEPGQQRVAETERYKSDNSLRGNMYQADSSRASHAYTADQKLRGDTIGAQASMRNNRARLEYDMMKDQRDYNLNVEKYGVEKASAALKQREASEKNLREQILGQLPLVPDKDGKMVPDEQGAAQYMRAAYARLGERESALRQELQQNPKNAQAAAELESLRHYGVAALSADPSANNQFMTGMQARGLLRKESGWTPWSADRAGGASAKPVTGFYKDNDSIWGGYRDQDGNWAPDYVIEREGKLFGPKTDKFKPLIKE